VKPLHYWPLDETGGTNVSDIYGDLQGTVYGDPGSATSITSGATGFGRARNLELGNPAHLYLHESPDNTSKTWSEWSVMVRFRRNSPGFVYPIVYAQRPTFTTSKIEVEITEGSEFYCILRNASGSQTTLSAVFSGSVFDGTWHRMTLTSNGSTVRMYLDDDQVASGSSTVLLMPESHQRIGWSGQFGLSGELQVDDIGLFDYELSAEQVAEWHDMPLSEIEDPDPEDPDPDDFEDWRAASNPLTDQTYYALDILGGALPLLRVPISSWQATIQEGRSNYAQAVIPAAQPWIEGILARANGEFFISAGLRYPDGSTQEQVIVRAPLRDARVDEGPSRMTVTLSSYWTPEPNSSPRTRTLQGIRSQANTPGLRMRADIDWFLRAGDTVEGRGQEFRAAYINFYVTPAQQYMDVGDRTE
jgi:hypothetical protein